MYLSRLYIQNYRSISQLDISFSPGKNVLVGRNNSGKSNIIKAINLVLGENSPDYKKSENLTTDDFYTSNESVSDEIIIWCELTRAKNEQLDYKSLYGSSAGYFVSADNYKNCVRYPIQSFSNDIPLTFKKNRNDGSNWINAKDEIGTTLEKELEPMHYFAYAFMAKRHGQDVDKNLRLFYREDESKNWVMSFYSAFRNELILSALIPSFRDPQTQLRINTWSWYGKLLKSITKDSKHESELSKEMGAVKEVSDKIFSDVGKKVTSSSIKTTFPGTTLHFQFNAETKTDLYKSCVIYVDDGFKSQLTEKGSGIQSAVIVGLFSYYMREINTIGSALLCIEEPELYLHPHGRRVMSTNLDLFLDDDRNQVILSTHSSEFINTPNDAQIVLVRKVEGVTTASCVNTKNIRRLLLDNDQNELFFADKVIICEGYDMYIIRWVADDLFPGKLDEQNISLIRVEGKDNFSTICKQLMDLQIECYILADFDFLLRDNDVESKTYNAKQHKNILSLTSRFFTQENTFGDGGNKVYRKIEKWRNALKGHSPQTFYEAKHLQDITDDSLQGEIKDLLLELRTHGICVLSGEIEDICIDLQRSVKEKLTLNDIYKIKSKIDAGSPLSELFDADEIRDLLCHVLNRPFSSDESIVDGSENSDYFEDDHDFEEDQSFSFGDYEDDDNIPF